MDNVLLLRVGIDTNNAGCHSPIFSDSSFEYIPIPETETSKESRTYSDIKARNEGSLSDYLPDKLNSSIPHYDPEFNTYTYGDPSKLKRTQLKNLEEGNLLIFYSGFDTIGEDKFEPRLFVIGYFVVEETFDLENKRERNKALKLTENAHIKRINNRNKSCSLFPVIVKGKPNRSKLFETTRILSTQYRNMVPSLAKTIGYSKEKDLTYAGTARRIRLKRDIQKIKIKKWLDYGLNSILDNKVYFVYKSNLSLELRDGYLIINDLMDKIDIEKGDWIIGFSEKQKTDIEFVLLVDYDKATIDNYDEIDISVDLKENSLIGSVFWFFQDKTLDKSEKLFIKPYLSKDNNVITNTSKISQFISYIEHNFRLGIHTN